MIAVAIDGPAGAGKSTISRRAAKELGFLYADTGSLYRAIGLAVLQAEIDPSDEEAVCGILGRLAVSITYSEGEQHVILCGHDVTGEIRSPEVSMAASKISKIPKVRAFLLSLQRSLAETNNVIMDGRDIGTVVLPDAQVKIFLTASPEDRARRRYEEMLGKGETADYEQVLADLKERDYSDSHRAVSPLVPADDAEVINTTGNTLEQSVGQLVSFIKGRMTSKNITWDR